MIMIAVLREFVNLNIRYNNPTHKLYFRRLNEIMGDMTEKIKMLISSLLEGKPDNNENSKDTISQKAIGKDINMIGIQNNYGKKEDD